MKNKVVLFLLLLMKVSLIFGHALSKIELKNETDIYEVKEDQSALLITHPKDEATKLREIIYYHIIERPYDAKDITHDKIEPGFEKRFFTNSHSGIQFEKNDCGDDGEEDESTSEELDDDSSNSSEKTDEDSNSSESNEERDNEQSSDKNDPSRDKVNDQNKSSSNRYGDNDSIKNDKSDVDSPIDADSIEIDIRFSDFLVNTTEGVEKVEGATNNVTAVPETKTEGISIYKTPQSRRKREINHTVTGKAKGVKTGEELNHADGKTAITEGGYGMSLTGNRGVVWNDVKPTHIKYYVGEPEALTTSIPDVLAEYTTTSESAKEPAVTQGNDEENQGDDNGGDDKEDEFIETLTEIENIFDKLIDNMDKTNKSESKRDNKTDGGSVKSKGKNKHEDDNEHDNGDSSLDPIEIEKSFIEIINVFKELTRDDTSIPTVTDVNDPTKSADDADLSQENVSRESSSGNFLRTSKGDEEVANDTPVESGAKLAPKRNEKNKETSYQENNSKQQQQFVKELLKNKYFWAWLKDASASFIEILIKKLDAVIKTEVGKQIEHFFKEHKNENCNRDTIDENVKGNTSDTPSSTDHNGLSSKDTTAESIKDLNETSSEILTTKLKDKPSNGNNAESSVKIEAQNLFGSSVGSDKVTNIFIYNINKAFDLENIKPIKNGTNGVFVFGHDDKKPVKEKEDASDKDTIPEVETVKPDIPSEHNNTVDKVFATDENQTNTEKPETEKDKIKDKDQVEDNIEHSTDKSEVIPNDQTSTEANNHDTTSIEINKEESASITEKPVEAIKDDKENDAKTENVETKKDLNESKETIKDKSKKQQKLS